MQKTKASAIRPPSRIYNPTKLPQSIFGRSQKLQNNIMIKPSSGNQRQKDYKFETQQEIQTQQECRKIQNVKNSCQKKNNSFSNILDDHIVEGKAEGEKKGNKKKEKKLGFYCCDSLAVRPSCNFNFEGKADREVVKEFSVSNFKGLSSGDDDQKSLSKFCNQVQRAHHSEPNQEFNKIELSLLSQQNQPHKQKQQIQRVNTVEYRSLRPSGYKHRKIFQQKYKIQKKLSQLNYNMPKALAPSNTQNSKKIRRQAQDDFHIIIETDEITSCCF